MIRRPSRRPTTIDIRPTLTPVPVIADDLPPDQQRRAITVETLMQRLAGTGVSVIHRDPNGQQYTVELRHDGDEQSGYLLFARAQNHLKRLMFVIESELIDNNTCRLSLRHAIDDEPRADESICDLRDACKMLGLEAKITAGDRGVTENGRK